jgi:intracellular sulfur oxidation DsrE/DsrF family protein
MIRRGLYRWLAVAVMLAVIPTLQAAEEELRFPGDEPNHKVVYQFNKADEAYQKAVLFSVGAMLRKYGDNIHIVVVAIGPGIHILGKHPERPVSEEIKQRVSSLSQYGVDFHACGNTMKSLHWEQKDMLPFAKYVEVGAADLMELQAQGYAYISW